MGAHWITITHEQMLAGAGMAAGVILALMFLAFVAAIIEATLDQFNRVLSSTMEL
jgi:hypothetical protein